MATYSKDGIISSHFNNQRHKAYDSLGRKNAKIFFESKGFTLKTNDRDEKNEIIYYKTDLIAIKDKDHDVCYPIECSVKQQIVEIYF